MGLPYVRHGDGRGLVDGLSCVASHGLGGTINAQCSTLQSLDAQMRGEESSVFHAHFMLQGTLVTSIALITSWGPAGPIHASRCQELWNLSSLLARRRRARVVLDLEGR